MEVGLQAPKAFERAMALLDWPFLLDQAGGGAAAAAAAAGEGHSRSILPPASAALGAAEAERGGKPESCC